MEPTKESKLDTHPNAGVDFSTVGAVHEEITSPQGDGYVAYGPSGEAPPHTHNCPLKVATNVLKVSRECSRHGLAGTALPLLL